MSSARTDSGITHNGSTWHGKYEPDNFYIPHEYGRDAGEFILHLSSSNHEDWRFKKGEKLAIYRMALENTEVPKKTIVMTNVYFDLNTFHIRMDDGIDKFKIRKATMIHFFELLIQYGVYENDSIVRTILESI